MNYYLGLIKQIARKYLIEIVLIFFALALGIGSFMIFLNSTPPVSEKISFQNDNSKPTNKKMYAEIAGAVVKPGVYELTSETRLNRLLELAHGLSDQADKNYFSRNFNLAHYIQDQEKVYIPTTSEINQGLFGENRNGQPSVSSFPNSTADETGKININSSSVQELDSLPGIGQVTAQKLIDNRPYQTIDDLLTKKVVKQNVFDSIKDKITIQ